jgi:quaternary ammonium compound-resistance protein SugE
MPWLWLVVAGLLEVVWAGLLPTTDGFTKLVPSVITVAVIAVSLGLLSYAVQDLPLGTAYAVWVGIGAAGTVVVGIVRYDDPVTPLRMLFLVLLIASVVGLKFTGGDAATH